MSLARYPPGNKPFDLYLLQRGTPGADSASSGNGCEVRPARRGSSPGPDQAAASSAATVLAIHPPPSTRSPR